MSHLSRESRSAVQLVQEFADGYPSLRAASSAIGMHPTLLGNWLRFPSKGLRPSTGRNLADFFGLPYEAVVFKHEPVKTIVRGLLRLLRVRGRKAA